MPKNGHGKQAKLQVYNTNKYYLFCELTVNNEYYSQVFLFGLIAGPEGLILIFVL